MNSLTPKADHLDTLLAARGQLEGQLKKSKAVLKQIDEEILTLSSEPVLQSQAATGKKDGVIRFTLEGNAYKAEIRKTVEWDQAKLAALAASLPYEKSSEILVISFSVPEKNFNSVAEGTDLHRKLMDARCVKYGTPKVVAKE